MFSVTKDLIWKFFSLFDQLKKTIKNLLQYLYKIIHLGLSRKYLSFQSAIECKFDDNQNILPYPTGKFQKSTAETDDEENNLNLIYSKKNTMDMVAQLTRSIKMKIS